MLTLEALEAELVNGFHDSQIESIFHDYVSATVVVKLELYVGTFHREVTSRYRRGEFTFSGVKFCAIELPDKESCFLFTGSLCITNAWINPPEVPQEVIRALPAGTVCLSLFNRDWYSHIHIAAADFSFRWTEPQPTGE